MRLTAFGAAGVLLIVTAAASTAADHACPFCGSAQGDTLVKQAQSARFVVYGTPSNSQTHKDADGNDVSSTDFTIEDVIKSDTFVKDKKKLVLQRFIPPTGGTQPDKLIVFCDVVNDQADAYLYLTTKDGALAKYLKESLKLDETDIPKRLRFYFDYLDSLDTEISGDSFKEFAKADYGEVVKMIKQYGNVDMKQRLKNWFKDPNTPVFRYGLFGLMLGLYGDKADGETFLELLNDPEKSLLTGVDGILAGYILADKDHGWPYTKQLVATPQNEFNKRYAGLRTMRFLYETHMGHVPAEELLDTLAIQLDQSDIADMVIEDLRRWKQWKYTDRIIALRDRETHRQPLVQRAILRYAVSCPQDKHPTAVAFVEEIKRKDPAKVKEAMEMLELEKGAQGPTEAQAKNAK